MLSRYRGFVLFVEVDDGFTLATRAFAFHVLS